MQGQSSRWAFVFKRKLRDINRDYINDIPKTDDVSWKVDMLSMGGGEKVRYPIYVNDTESCAASMIFG